MLWKSRTFAHLHAISHDGKVVVVATDADGGLWYSVKQDGFEDSYLSTPPEQRIGWEDWRRLALPDEPDDASVVARELAENTEQRAQGRHIVRSLWRTADQSAVAPVQLVSGLGHLHVLRQSRAGTLLVDRFVLDGLTNTLGRKLQVRYRRSRQRHEPSKRPADGLGGLPGDSLDFRDIDGAEFHEPTTELCLIDGLTNGCFAAVLLPTSEQDRAHWHIFTVVADTVVITSLRSSDDGLFAVHDATVPGPTPRRVPGVVQRTLDLGVALSPAHGLAAARYDVQRERITDGGPQLLRESVRVMLAARTAAGDVLTVSLGVAPDGTLSRLADGPGEEEVVRRTARPLLLPLRTLDEVEALGLAAPPAHGLITGLAMDDRGGVLVHTAAPIAASPGQKIRLSEGASVDAQHAHVTRVDEHTFEVAAPAPGLGKLEVLPADDAALVASGMVTAYARTPGGGLRVTAVNHGLTNGEAVQIVDTRAYDGTHTVSRVDADTLRLDGVKWQPGAAMGVEQLSQRRRGIVFDGVDDFVEVALREPTTEITHELWFRTADPDAGLFAAVAGPLGARGHDRHIYLRGGNIGVRVHGGEVLGAGGPSLADDRWHHVAHVMGASVGGQRLYVDGVEVAEGSRSESAFDWQDTLLFGFSNDGAHAFLRGQLAEVRVWGKARTAAEIRRDMFLPLTGREAELLGLWHLGAILGDRPGTAVDASLYLRHGVVQGGAHVAPVVLPRALPGSNTPALRYENREPIAVVPRGTYTEEIEFRVDPPVDPAVFTVAPLGKRSEAAAQWTAVPASTTTFTHVEGPWHRASATYTIPDGVTLLRAFGLADVRGAWSTLTIRRHTIQHVVLAITRVRHAEVAAVPRLDDALAGQRSLARRIGADEATLAALVVERRDLAALLALLDRPDDAARATKQQQLDGWRQLLGELQAGYAPWEQDERVADAAAVVFENGGYTGLSLRAPLGRIRDLRDVPVGAPGNFMFGFENLHDRISSARVPNGLRLRLGEHDDLRGRVFEFTADVPFIHEFNDFATSLEVTTIHGQTDPAQIRSQASAFRREILQCETAIAGLTAELATLNAAASELAARRAPIVARIAAIDGELAALATTLAQDTASYLGGPFAAPPLAMATLATVRGLTSQAAVLGFVRPTSRLTALESCRGELQLHHVDDRGRLCAARFDAALALDPARFERWSPEPPRACLDLATAAAVLKPAEPLLPGDAWTLETWFFYPLPPSTGYSTLARGRTADHHVVVAHGPAGQRLGVYFTAGGFRDSGFDLRGLTSGWHHLAAVADGDGDAARTRFYLDAALVGEVAGKTTREIACIGNNEGADQPFGRLSELRLWGAALTAEELLAHSHAALTGDEPGLLAHYPLDEGRDAVAHDRSPRANHAAVIAAAWRCGIAPIGNPGRRVMKFDGVDDHLELPPLDLDCSAGLTIEVWVNFRRFTTWARIIDFGNGIGADNLLFAVSGTSRTIYFQALRGADGPALTAPEPLRPGVWTHLAVTLAVDGAATIYRDGAPIATGTLVLPRNVLRSRNYIGRSNWPNDSYFDGQMTELRLSRGARTPAEIRARMHRRFTGREPDLLHCWRLDDTHEADGLARTRDLCAGKDAAIRGPVFVVSNTLPIAGDTVVAAEYSSLGVDRRGLRIATMRRLCAAPDAEGVRVLADRRVEALELAWIGNGQFAPTLLGYIEGPPPVPGENLTRRDDYDGATAVALSLSEDVAFQWTRSQDSGNGVDIASFLGVDAQTSAGVFVQTRVLGVRLGLKADVSTSYQAQNHSSITSSSSQRMTDRLELRGTPEDTPRFPHLGRRYIPKNVGYALVVSALADVFVTRLARSKRMIGYQVVPAEGVPPDVNTITFLINPAYTMNGSLDGLTGTGATSQRFHRHVPELRAQVGSLYPASYYRLQEAYALKQRIEQQDKDRAAYFAQFGALPVDARLADPGAPAPDAPGEADASAAVNQRQAAIDARISDPQVRAHAAGCFAGWQRRMEDLQLRAGKRNIVNTYVWDADGGLRAEVQSFASTAEHTIGGTLSLTAGLGVESQQNYGGAAAELTALATLSMSQTMSKTETRSRGITLDVDLSGVESKGITDHDDNPLQPGEKVDRYRFMSFYLEGSTDHFHEFFRDVVDPEWLASNDEEARALRQARGQPNKVWRVLHRVTYVERPALMAIGRDTRAPVVPGADMSAELAALRDENQQLRSRLDQILALLRQPGSFG